MTTGAVIYCRISKDEAGEALGVERQKRACRELATARGLDVVGVLVDNDVSAYRAKVRPEFERLVELLKDGTASAVVCYHADRLYRRTTDLERLVTIVEATGAQVHSVAAGDVDLATASGRMVARMLGAAAQHESERMGERIRMKHDELARKGRPPGGRPPYGYAWGYLPGPDGELRRTYVIDTAEAEALRLMARRVLEGASLLAIRRELNAAGIPTRQGRPWHHSSVRASLVNPAVAGMRVHRREVAGPGEWEPVLDRATWEEVRAVLADPSRRRRRVPHKYLLTGLVENANGDPMTGRPDRNSAGAIERRTYATRSPSTTSTVIDADVLEAHVVADVLEFLDDVALPEPAAPTGGEEIAAIEAELDELAALRGAGKISLSEWLAAREPLQARLDTARRTAGFARRPGRTAQLLRTPGAARAVWDQLDVANQREIIEAVLERVVVGPATRGRWSTIEERLDPDAGYGVRWR